jgi:hypothetical protein
MVEITLDLWYDVGGRTDYGVWPSGREGVEMSVETKAIETAGTIDANCQLVLDDPLPIAGPKRVRVIILVPDETEMDEAEWLRAAATSPALDFLKDPTEDIYTIQDGKPFHDPG